MATVYSDFMTNLNAGTSNPMGVAGIQKKIMAHYAAAGAITLNDVVAMFPISVDAVITSVRFASDDLGTTGLLHVGFHKVDGTTAVNNDAIGTSIDVKADAVAITEIRYETLDINTIGQKAWELAGLSARPDYDEFLVTVTAAEATTAAGDFILIVEYV
jgi:hypothetical protein